MGVLLTGTLIVVGSLFAIGTTGAIVHAATEDERNAAEKKRLETENEGLRSAKNYVESVKDKLKEARDKLSYARDDFKNGGHVLDGVPLANTNFQSCLDKLDNAMTYAERLVSDFDETIAANESSISKLS